MADGVLGPGDVLLDTYRIVRQLGVGGTGEVYLAQSMTIDRKVAVKVLKHAHSQDPAFVKLLERELLQNVKHDAVVTYLDLHQSREHGGLYFLVMEYIDGPSLSDLMANGPVDADTLMAIGRRVADALKAAHGAKVFHRDVSPDNILLRGGDPHRATLIDFGIAKDVRPTARTVVGDGFAGKYEYAAPEQLDGNTDGRSDLYSLGATLLAAARGKPPQLPTATMELYCFKHQRMELSDVGGPLGALIRRMVEPKPEDRFQSAGEVLRAFDQEGADVPEAAPEALLDIGDDLDDALFEDERRSSRGWLRPAIFACLAVLIAGAAFLAYDRGLFEGLLAPPLPEARPYRLNAELGTPWTVRGDAPSEEARELILAAVRGASEGEPVAGIRLARGVPSETWAPGVAAVIEEAAVLEELRIEVINNQVTVRGLAASSQERDELIAALGEASRAAGLTFEHAIRARRRPLTEADLAPVLAEYNTCGTLEIGGRGAPIQPDDRIVIDGKLPNRDAVDALEQALAPLADGRDVRVAAQIYNRSVCRILLLMAPREQGDLGFVFSYGATGQINNGNDFAVTDIPVIDLLAPQGLDGYVHTFIADNEGLILKLLPHLGREEDRLQNIGTVQSGRRRVRLAFRVDEQTFVDSPQAGELPCIHCALQFTGDAAGIYYVFAVLTDQRLFPELAERMMNVEVFAPDLAEALSQAERRGVVRAVALRQLNVGVR